MLFSQSFLIFENDTVNITDEEGLKQGLWLYFFNDGKTISQKGEYIDSKKEGIWQTFYENENPKTSITYSKNRQTGYAIIYYDDGTICEEGNWKENRWIGEYKYYYKNGEPAYIWNFDEEGARNGTQKYFHENGNLRIEGEWIAGKETGLINEYYENGNLKISSEWNEGRFNGIKKEYYANGTIKSERFYNDGQIDENLTVYYPYKEEIVAENDVDTIYTTIIMEKDSVAVLFTGSGFHKLYNKNKLLEQEGKFKNGYLQDGKKYFYNQDNKLIRTEIYENGELIETIREN